MVFLNKLKIKFYFIFIIHLTIGIRKGFELASICFQKKIKSCLLAVAITSGLVILIASLSYLIVTNQESINNFFGKNKENKLEVLNEKIKDVQSSEENNSNQLKKTIDEISEQLVLMNKKYADDQAALANKLKKINSVQQKKLIDKHKANKISKKFNTDDNEKILESDITLAGSIKKNIDFVTSVNDESVNRWKFINFESRIYPHSSFLFSILN